MYIKDKDGNYVPTPSSKGADGREVSLRVANNYIQWRYPDTEWTNLVPLSDLKGEPGTDGIDGREVHMRVVSDTLQWRLGDSGTWQTLMSLSTVTDGAAFGGMVVDKTLVLAEMEAGGGGGGTADAVTYTPQTLTEEQKSQARTNIGAEKAGTGYSKPASGIPKSDLAQSVQTSLDKADTAISLGLTAATPGQIIKVKAVQDGKPTEWEAVDMPGGGVEWYEVIDMETTENVNDLIISTDKNGRLISGYHALAMVLCFMVPADSTQTSPNGAIWVYPMASNYLSSGLRIITNVATWKTIPRTFNYFYAGSNRALFVSSAISATIFDGSYNNVFDGIRLYIHNAGDHLPTGTKVRCLVLSKGWTA